MNLAQRSKRNRIKFAGKLPLMTDTGIPVGHHIGVSMDVSAIASVATEMSQTQTAQAVQIAVLKKAMDIESQSALQLLQAIPSNPPNLGNNVDLFA